MYRQLISVLALAASVSAVSHKIDVGEDGKLKFEPESLTAAVGDTLVFHFYPESGPHSVVSSTFQAPCVPETGAFFSGYIDGNSDGDTTFTVNVTSTDPIYFYCSLKKHCQNGMVGAVNAPSGSGVTQYLAAARSVSAASAPSSATGGAVATVTGSDDESSSTASGSATTTGSGASAATTTTSAGSTGSTGSATSDAASGSGSAAATTTPSGAGKNSQTPVVLGLAVVLGGLAALMA